jgi:hypothetical protein
LFRPDLRLGEDIEMWSRIAGRFPWVFVDEPLAIYNRNPESSVTMRPGLLPDFSFLYTEEEMRALIEEELWSGYRIFRRDQTLQRCRTLLRYGATREVRKALKKVPPAPPSSQWLGILLLGLLPSSLARMISSIAVGVKRYARLVLQRLDFS